MKRRFTTVGNLINVQQFMQEEQMASYVTKYVVSPSVDNCELRLVAQRVDATFLPEELELLGTFAAIYWNGGGGKCDVNVLITPTKKVGAAHERNGST